MYDQIISMVRHPLPCWQEVFSEWNGAMFPAFMGTFTIPPPPPLPASPSSTPATWSVLMIRTSRCKMSAPHIWANSSAFFKSCVLSLNSIINWAWTSDIFCSMPSDLSNSPDQLYVKQISLTTTRWVGSIFSMYILEEKTHYHFGFIGYSFFFRRIIAVRKWNAGICGCTSLLGT